MIEAGPLPAEAADSPSPENHALPIEPGGLYFDNNAVRSTGTDLLANGDKTSQVDP